MADPDRAHGIAEVIPREISAEQRISEKTIIGIIGIYMSDPEINSRGNTCQDDYP
jgi:hypothetical protein